MVVAWSREESHPIHEEGLPYPIREGGVSVVHQGLRGKGRGRGNEVGVDHGHLG